MAQRVQPQITLNKFSELERITAFAVECHNQVLRQLTHLILVVLHAYNRHGGVCIAHYEHVVLACKCQLRFHFILLAVGCGGKRMTRRVSHQP